MEIDGKLKLGGIYWPLIPYRLFLNDLALEHDGKFQPIGCKTNDKNKNDEFIEEYKFIKEYKEYFDFSGDRKIDEYHKYFLLHPEIKDFSVRGDAVPDIKIERPYSDAFEVLEGKINGEKSLESFIRSAMLYFPQGVREEGKISLFASQVENWEKITDRLKGKPYDELLRDISASKSTTSLFEKLYVCGEWLLLDRREREDVVHSFFSLFDIEFVSKCLPETRGNIPEKSKLLLVPCSFFGDGKIDLVLYLIVDPSCESSPDKVIASIFYGLSRVILEERKRWLDRWRLDLGDRIESELKDSDQALHEEDINTAADFAATAIIEMADVLLCNEALTNDVDEIKKFLKDKKKDEETDLEDALKNLTNGSFSYARKKFVKAVLKPALEDACRIIQGDDGTVLKGFLSIGVNSHLRNYATLAPLSTRILLRGAPGGGKGAATEQYHNLVMETLFGRGSFKELIGKIKKNDEVDRTKYKKERWLAYLDKIKESLQGMFRLPRDKKAIDNRQDFFLFEIEGTNWRDWKPGKDGREILGGIDEENINNFYDRKIIKKVKLIGDFFKIPVIEKQEQEQENRLVAEFLLRFMVRAYEVILKEKDEDNKTKGWNFNMFQLACGALGGSGAELTASLRQLFGYAPSLPEQFASPGLFQICSYVGGTLFLDEVADAPVRIQDNLLVPLEEKKVAREGWETIKEDVGNIRIVSATHKDLNLAVEEYRQTMNSPHPRGFRPDLLTRLGTTPPVNVQPISAYFNYDDEDGVRGRSRYRAEFARIMDGISICKDDSSFWKRVYDRTDRVIEDFISTSAVTDDDAKRDKRKELSLRISMRFFMNICAMLEENKSKKEKAILRTFILERHIPRTLSYLLNGS